MANKTNSLSRTTWMCKYHIVFIPKYRRKATIMKYISEQEKHDIALDKLSVKEYEAPFKGSK